MKLTPNYYCRRTNDPLYAMLAEDTPESRRSVCDLLGLTDALSGKKIHIELDGETLRYGDWITVCLCEECKSDPSILRWDPEEFAETFAPMPVADQNRTTLKDLPKYPPLEEQKDMISKIPNDEFERDVVRMSGRMQALLSKAIQAQQEKITLDAFPVTNWDRLVGRMMELPAPVIPISPIGETKQFRKDLDAVLQRLRKSSRKSPERDVAILKIREAVMWLGMDLKELGTPTPYPSSYDPSSPVVEPTADGLKL